MRFGGFDEGEYDSYKKYFFKDIFLFSTGKNIKQNEASPEFETPCVRYGELYHMYNEVITEVINKTNLDKSELLFSDGDEILLPSAGEDPLDIGSASALTIKDVAIGRTINILKPAKANIYSQLYVAYYINQRLRKTISTLAKGVSISNVYNSDLKTLEIMLPKLPEQTKIASFLSLIDDRIQTQKKTIKNLQSLIKGLSEKIFTQKLKFKDDKGNDFPDWEVKKLREVCEVIMGQSPSSTSYNTEAVGVPLIQGNADILNRQTYPRNWTTEITKECVVGDLILTVRAPVGAVAKSIHNACIGRGVCAIRSNLGYSIEFVYQFLLSYEDKWNRLEQGSTFTAVSGNEIRNVEIPFPSIEEQNKIANFLSFIDERIETEKKILEQYEAQKKYLLQNLFI